MSLGLLDDDNPWNDNSITTPDTGLAAAADSVPAEGDDAVNERLLATSSSVPNGHVAADDPADAARFERNVSNGHAPEPAGWSTNGWPPASSPPPTNGAASRRPSATASTSSTSSPPASRLHRSTSNASTKSRPAGWTTPAPAALQRSASRASTSSGRRPSGGAGDVNVKTAADGWTSAPRLHRSSSSASSRGVPNGAAAIVQTLGDAWASATSLHRASSTSSSTTASRPLFSTPTPTSTPPPQTQLRRRKGGHTRAQTVDVTHDAHPLSQPPSPAASPPPSPPPRVTHTVSRSDSLAGVALRYGVTVAALRRANGLWANDSIHLRTELVIPDGKGDPFPPPAPAPKTNHVRARTSAEQPRDVQGRRSLENARAADVAASFSLTLPRLRLSLDTPDSDAEHELLPLSLSARRRKSRPQLSMTTTKQPSPIRGMVLPRAE